MTAEPTTDTADHGEKLRDRLDILIAVLLGIGAIGLAWAAYQSSLFGGDAAASYNDAAVKTAEAATKTGEAATKTGEATLKTDEASQLYNEGDQSYIQDQAIFLEYVKAIQADNADLAAYLRETLMSDELYAAIQWWEAQPPETAPDSPFDEANPDYTNVSYDDAAALDDEATALLGEAAAANKEADAAKVAAAQSNQVASTLDDQGDEYDLVAALLAPALFLLGIAGVFKFLPVKIGGIVLGAAFLVWSFVLMAGYDRM